jgi:hypothetical protein
MTPTPAVAAAFRTEGSLIGLRLITFERPSTRLSDPDTADRLAARLDALTLYCCKSNADETR